MLRRSFVLGLGAALLCAGVAVAGEMPRVQFPRGANGVTLRGAVASPDRNIYRVSARAGQTMTVTVMSEGDNAVFQIYEPGTTYSEGDEGWNFAGSSLPGTEEGSDARAYDGALPRSGSYVIVVGPSRGSTEYELNINIR